MAPLEMMEVYPGCRCCKKCCLNSGARNIFKGMSENETSKQENKQQNTEQITASDYEFLQERIKERPINKKKLLQRTIITATSALLFGAIACLAFLLLEPMLSNWLYPEEESNTTTFPQEQDEMLPEDMLTEGTTQPEDEQQSEEVQQSDVSETQTEVPEASRSDMSETQQTDIAPDATLSENIESGEDMAQEDVIVPLEAYQLQYDELYSVYRKVSASMVTVTAVRTDVDWFNNPYQSEGSAAGVIIANNNRELLILTKKDRLEDAESIKIRFCNGTDADAEIKKFDANTNLSILAVELKYIDTVTLGAISTAVLETSPTSGNTGTPVIAIGNLFGSKDNVCYGIVTSNDTHVSLADSEYRLITTDIYASENPSGVLANVSGNIIGIIDNSYNNADTKNLLSAVKMTELMDMIGKLSNGEDIPYLGIHAQDISIDVRNELGLPQGAYIVDIDMDSPAMLSGIQRGDIIVQVGAKEIRNAADYMEALFNAEIDRDLSIYVYRESRDDYQKMQFVATPSLQPDIAD